MQRLVGFSSLAMILTSPLRTSTITFENVLAGWTLDGAVRAARGIRGVALVLTACLLTTAQAKAAVMYAVGGTTTGGPVSLPYEFSVTSADFITAPTLLTPSASTCTVPPNPIILSCEVGPNVIFFPGMLGGFDATNVPLYLPSQIGWTLSITAFNGTTNVTIAQSFSAVFGLPFTVGGTAFELLGTYPGFAPNNGTGPLAGVGILTVSGSPGGLTPVPEPTSLLLFGSGAVGVLIRMRRQKQQCI